jgi:hypothetical protein
VKSPELSDSVRQHPTAAAYEGGTAASTTSSTIPLVSGSVVVGVDVGVVVGGVVVVSVMVLAVVAVVEVTQLYSRPNALKLSDGTSGGVSTNRSHNPADHLNVKKVHSSL